MKIGNGLVGGQSLNKHREYNRKVTLKAHSKQIRVLAGSAVPIGGIPEAARAVALGAGP